MADDIDRGQVSIDRVHRIRKWECGLRPIGPTPTPRREFGKSTQRAKGMAHSIMKDDRNRKAEGGMKNAILGTRLRDKGVRLMMLFILNSNLSAVVRVHLRLIKNQ